MISGAPDILHTGHSIRVDFAKSGAMNNLTGSALKFPLFALIGILLLIAGCEYEPKVMNVAAKNISESEILAEMVAILAENEGITVRRQIPYGDEFDSFEGIRQGAIDIYPEYNGTALSLTGHPAISDSEKAWIAARDSLAPLGLQWAPPLGFSNDYVLVVTDEVSQDHGIESISDLRKLNESGVRFATDETYPARPVDGLEPLIRRYGLRKGDVKSFDVSEGEKADLYAALLRGDVDVAEVHSTDGDIDHYGLVILEDDLSFFPDYSSAYVVRADLLDRFPEMKPVLDKLGGKITAANMQRLNFAVDHYGRSARDVAAEFLAEIGLAEKVEESDANTGLHLAVASNLGLNDLHIRLAWDALRDLFDGVPVVLVHAINPAAEVMDHNVRFAVASADSLFANDGDSPQVFDGVEAIGLLGHQNAHVVSLSDGPDSLTQMTLVGVGPEGDSSHRIADIVWRVLGLDGEQITGSSADQFAQLRSGELDGLFLVATEGDAAIADEFGKGGLTLRPLSEWNQSDGPFSFAFLRPVTIAGETYPSQSEPVESIGTQIVLLGQSGPADVLGGRGGPVTTEVLQTPKPIEPDKVRKLNQKLASLRGSSEALDPVLPISDALKRQAKDQATDTSDELDVSITSLVFVGLIVALVFLLRPRRLPEASADSGRLE